MHVAYVCADTGVPVYGAKGCSVHVQAVVRAFAARGDRVTLLASRWDAEAPGDLRAIEQVALPPAPKGEPAARERLALGHNGALRAALNELDGVDMVYERYSLWSHAAMTWAEQAGVPAVLEVNALLIDEQATHRTLVDRAGAERAAARALAGASAVVAVSDGVAGWLGRFPEAAGKVHVIANGFDPERFAVADAARQRPCSASGARSPAPPFTVGFLGSLKPWHGLDTLVDAFAVVREGVPEARLRLIGDGPQTGAVRARLAARGLSDAATLTGAVDPAGVPAELAATDVAVAPYPDLRPFYFSPLKIVESMAAGLPVVCSRVGGLDRLVEHGRTGLLVAPGDTTGLARALARLAADAAFRRRLGRAGRNRVLDRHTWGAVVERVVRVAVDRETAGVA